MAEIEVTTDSSIPNSGSITITVNDGSGNTASKNIAAGTQTYTFTGFDTSSQFWVDVNFSTSDVRYSASLHSIDVSTAVSAPSTPQNLTSTVSQDDITLDWDSVNWNGDQGHYDVYRGQSSGSHSQIAQVSSGTTTYTDSSLEDGERYYYIVDATNSAGTSGDSNETDETTALPAPSSLSATKASGGDIALSWTNNDDSSDGGHDVERSDDGGATWSSVTTGLSTATTSYTDSSVDPGTQYDYRIERNTNHATATSGSATEVASGINIGGNYVSNITVDGDSITKVTTDGDRIF